jgi:leucyl aminopeptidase
VQIRIVTGDIRETEADAVVVGIYEGAYLLEDDTAEMDKILGGVITRLISHGEIKGKINQQSVIFSLGKISASRIIVAGLGKKDELTADRIRGVIAVVCRSQEENNLDSIAVTLPGTGIISDQVIAQAITEGAMLGTYSFLRHMTKEAEHGKLKHLILVTPDKRRVSALRKGSNTGRVTSDAVIRTRDMVNEPANFMTPSDMAAVAEKIAAENGLEVEILEKDQMKKLGMGALLGVSQGSIQPPKFIILKYNGAKSKEIDLALIGKAITFDSGGISIKASSGMEEMKDDMAGGAAVISAMGAVARLKPAINVIGLVPATENLPGGRALKPGDVLTAMGGKTIEIITTDAEGRLVLADAIGYARKLGVKRIVDAATLTGAIQAAFGDVCSGSFSNNQELADRVISAGLEAGERIWQMPMYEDYRELNKSDVADLKNTGGKFAGSIAAAHFLGEFVGDVPWVHLDIAGVVWSDKTKKYITKGATGVPVRTMVNLVMSLAESKSER